MDWVFLPFQRYFELSGRSTRREYWLFTLFGVVVYAFATVLMVIGGLGLDDDAPDYSRVDATFWFGVAVAALYALISFIPSITVVVRRLHDRDLSGWWYLGFILVGWVPLINLVAGLVFLVQLLLGGNTGSNRFGPDPRYQPLDAAATRQTYHDAMRR
ncbi:DUF805 domain-containing protein [Novosphingobium sp.]|uniref:DUF805 domain-containing protein n=1 Tax=Novosphingobium sp. TaxID=1874826 RepID=UPI00261EC24C|nr:DUF805 domain-containing protein [Novosphingobium sp.]